jgi:hypothetical protein
MTGERRLHRTRCVIFKGSLAPDQALRSMKRCTYCGKEHEDTATVCDVDRESLVQVYPPANNAEASECSVEFIRLFFKSPEEEEFAVRCAKVIARFLGERSKLLRPDTTWSEIFLWFGQSTRDAAMFALLLKKEFGRDFREVLNNYEFMTFRDFVEHVCGREHQGESNKGRPYNRNAA